MFMATKTLTITEDSYKLLIDNKLGDESFSEEIKRILARKKARKLSDFLGVLSEKEGADMLKDLEKARSMNIKLIKDRIR